MRLSVFSSVSLLVLAATSPVYAGFEFVSPSGSAAASNSAPSSNDSAMVPVAPVVVPQAPIQSDNLDAPIQAPERVVNTRSTTPIAPVDVPLTPVVNDSDALAIESRPYEEAHHSSPSRSAPSAMPEPIGSMNSLAEPIAPAAPVASTIGNDGTDVQGFGRNVPLAIALQQIVPASYRYSFDKPINPSMKISWQGGKPWKQIIADIARTNNLNVDIASNVVSFKRQSPMDMIASETASANAPDMVQGMKLKPLAGQQTAAPSAPSSDMIYDNPLASTTPSPSMASSSRQELASISDLPSAAPATGAPTSILPTAMPPVANTAPPTPPAPAEKSAFFDSMMDADAPANGTVKDKKIVTDSKPVDILDKVSVASPNTAAKPTPPSEPRPVESVPAPTKPLPASPSNAPIDITKQIDNSPVTSNELPAPGLNPASAAPPVDTTSKAGLATNQEWQGHKGETLRQTLTAWSEQAGVSLVWSSEYDYPLQTDVRIQATYADSVRTLLAGFSKAQPRPIGRLFKNDKVGAQPVLILETQRLTN